MFKPFKSLWYYGGVLLGLPEWFGLWMPHIVKEFLLNLPGIWFLITLAAILALIGLSKWASSKIRALASGDKNNFGPCVVSSIAGSAHSLLGLASVAGLNFFVTLTPGSNIKLLLTCLCIAIPFYWQAQCIQQLVTDKS